MTTLTVDVSNSDLFGGDLDVFGDELIDMHGATAVSETEPSINQGILRESCDNKPTEIGNSSNNLGQVIENGRSDVAVLDGLGAFRRTSFNEFSELHPLPPFPAITTRSVPMKIPLSPATVLVSNSSATLERQASQSLLSHVAGSSAMANAPDTIPADSTRTKTNMTLTDKNYAAVVPSSLLPTETGVKANQQAAASQDNIPDPLEASRHAIVKNNRTVSNNAIAPTSHAEQILTPDQITSHIETTTVQVSNATTPIIAKNNAQLQTKNTVSTNPDAASQSTITAAAVAAATNAPLAADFTAVAQEAVSNLIKSSNIEDKEGVMMNSTKSQAVSTARVAALTSANWASVVNNNTNNTMHSAAAPTLVRDNTGIASVSTYSLDQQHTDTQAPASKRRRQNLTPDERAKQNRDRNREHARNTRLRKKAFVEELKRTLSELVTQHNANEAEKKRVAQLEFEQREVRFRVAEEFMKLRGDNQRSTTRWAAILEKEFTFTLPVTKYRNMVLSDSGTTSTQGLQQPTAIPRQVSGDGVNTHAVDENRSEQILRGVEEAKTDAEHLESFLERLYFPDHLASANNPHAATKNISIIYDCKRKNFFMDGTSAFLNWTATTHFLSGTTLPPLTFKGVLRAAFSPASNKLLSLELYFDTGVIISHIDRIQSIQAHHGAAAEADAILDSLEMPYFLPTSVSTAIFSENTSKNNDIIWNNPASITSSEKSDSEI